MLGEGSSFSLNIVKEPIRRRKAKEKESSSFASSIETKKEPIKFGFGKTEKSFKSNSIWKRFKEENKPSFKSKAAEQSKPNKSKKITFEENPTPKLTAGFSVKKDNTVKSILKKNFQDDNEKLINFKKAYDSDYGEKSGATGHNVLRTTSLFGNNPEIPMVLHQNVKPVKEAVFSKMAFKDLKLHPYMVKYLEESMNLTKMTTVQSKSIPVLLQGYDTLIRSQTGSGKTLAFVLPILNSLQQIRPKINRSDGILALVIVPTRELALQTYEIFNKLVKSYTWIVPGFLVGGESRKSEKARLRKGVSILIGTPGRVIDHMENTKAFKLDKVSWLILDEADRLLDLGYEKNVSAIINKLSEDGQKPRQTVLLSATLTPGVKRLAGLSLSDPVYVDACEEIATSSLNSDTNILDTVVLPSNLVQMYVVTPPKLRLVTLAAMILWQCKLTANRKMLVFIATQDMVDYHTELISTALSNINEDDEEAEESDIQFFKLHGSMNQSQRTDVFNTFRKADSGVLFCTDVASRGLDLPEVDWVIQYTGPTSIADYVHRVGRTARGGQSGSSVIFLTPTEVEFINKLEDCKILLREEKMESCLDKLLILYPGSKSVEEAATYLQSTFETIVTEQRPMHELACKAYSSWTCFYSTYPRNMKRIFNVKTIHQGHYAKSFALREPPSAIIRHAKPRIANDKRFTKKRINPGKRKGVGGGNRVGIAKRKRTINVSEFDAGFDGLEPETKKRKR